MRLEIKGKNHGKTSEVLINGKPLEKVRRFSLYHAAGDIPIFSAEILPQTTELIEEEAEVFLRVGTRRFKVIEEVEE